MAANTPKGYNGKVLRVDLSNGKVAIEKIDDSFCRKYLGGAGFIAHHLLSGTKPGIDPLGPENKLIFATGPLTGLNFGGSARHTVGAKSPLTGGIAKSEVGEHWGAQFKRAGYDALIVEGQAKDPVYLWIHDGEVEIKDASHTWGKNTKETQETIRSQLSDAGARLAMIGPAGENRVRYACLMHGPFDAAGRGGTGAVMGSKNLKAVAVRGNRMPATADSDGVKKIRQWLNENMELVKGFSDFGTGAAVPSFEQMGNLPIRNFRDGGFPNASAISAVVMKEQVGAGMEGCFACPVRCKKALQFQEPYPADRAYGGPEYETIGALGSACGVDDLKAVVKGGELCNAFSLDTISTGMSIAFAMECVENGLLTSEDTGGLDLTFGNADGMLRAIESIARREGIGDLLAEGTARAAKKIGRGAEAYAMHVKNLEIPMHEPRLNKALGLGYMVNPHGADHTASMIEIFFRSSGEHPSVMFPDAAALGYEPAPFADIGPKKVALFTLFQMKRIFIDALVICLFLPYSFQQLVELLASVTGWDTSVAEQTRVAQRILTMCRMYNLREGLTAADDQLPPRFFEPTRGGPLSDQSLTPEEMDKGKRYYYSLMGWDDQGVPTPEKVEELGIDHLATRK
jgi:aldehyde:ferredoxin oxidoreductase